MGPPKCPTCDALGQVQCHPCEEWTCLAHFELVWVKNYKEEEIAYIFCFECSSETEHYDD